MTQNNQLLIDILDHLASSEEARERFNQNKCLYTSLYRSELTFNSSPNQPIGVPFLVIFNSKDTRDLQFIIQTALSNTPDGKAVCEFLGKEVKIYDSYEYPAFHNARLTNFTGNSELEYSQYVEHEREQNSTTHTLNRLLYTTLNQALFNGKDFETALEEANEIYLKNINN